MVNTGWKKAIDRSGRSQRSLAKALSVNIAELSMVVQGRAFLTPEKFDRACELLECRPTDLYSADVLSLLYGAYVRRDEPKKRDTRVRLDEVTYDLVERYAKENKITKTFAASRLINYALLHKGE